MYITNGLSTIHDSQASVSLTWPTCLSEVRAYFFIMFLYLWIIFSPFSLENKVQTYLIAIYISLSVMKRTFLTDLVMGFTFLKIISFEEKVNLYLDVENGFWRDFASENSPQTYCQNACLLPLWAKDLLGCICNFSYPLHKNLSLNN